MIFTNMYFKYEINCLKNFLKNQNCVIECLRATTLEFKFNYLISEYFCPFDANGPFDLKKNTSIL